MSMQTQQMPFPVLKSHNIIKNFAWKTDHHIRGNWLIHNVPLKPHLFSLTINVLCNKQLSTHLLDLLISDGLIHDDVIQWKHFQRYWPFVRGFHRSPVNSHYKGQWRGALMFSLMCAWTNSWANHRDTGDLRRHHAHYDVTVMLAIRGSTMGRYSHLNPSYAELFSKHDIYIFYPISTLR